MSLNQELADKVILAKEELNLPIVTNRTDISLEDWFKHIRTTPRVADEKYLKAFNERLRLQGIIT